MKGSTMPKELLTERLEVRLTKTMRTQVVEKSKQLETSEGAVIRKGLENLFKSKGELRQPKP